MREILNADTDSHKYFKKELDIFLKNIYGDSENKNTIRSRLLTGVMTTQINEIDELRFSEEMREKFMSERLKTKKEIKSALYKRSSSVLNNDSSEIE